VVKSFLYQVVWLKADRERQELCMFLKGKSSTETTVEDEVQILPRNLEKLRAQEPN